VIAVDTPLMGQVDLLKLEEKLGVWEKVNLPIELLNQNLARMTKEHIDSAKLAKIFFKEHPEIWHGWVSEAAAKKFRQRCNL
jgi:glycine betaine/proline transport system substrate-binding protein